ncbi:MAG: hypothetical protein GKR86_06855, partial [Ilumatobacter sp.]|nr:hypothetical protein [Ilumatobacter sp.]
MQRLSWIPRMLLVIAAGALLIVAIVVAVAPRLWNIANAHSQVPVTLPAFEALAQRTYVYDADGNEIAVYELENSQPINYEDIPDEVIQAFLLIEDKEFFTHDGVNVRSLFRATLSNFASDAPQQGASTITMQVVKNDFLAGLERDGRYKLLQIQYAKRLEKEMSKEVILERYLNTVFFGNNAYGIQSREICRSVTSAWRKGRVDVVVQSTDKNFMVPVGGSFLLARKGCEGMILDRVNSMYPGRASMGPTMDVVMTLLHLGERGWQAALEKRDASKARLFRKLKETCAELGETPIVVPGNDISFGMTLDTFAEGPNGPDKPDHGASFLGSMLFRRCASGARVLVNSGKESIVGGVSFLNFGQSHDDYPHAYLTVAAALGMDEAEVDEFFDRLRACAREFFKKKSKR